MLKKILEKTALVLAMVAFSPLAIVSLFAPFLSRSLAFIVQVVSKAIVIATVKVNNELWS